MSYHENAAINDTVLAIVNDGNGSMCGMTYAQRCAAADTGIGDFRIACRKYSDYRVRVFEQRKLLRTEVIEAANLLQRYYLEHAKEFSK